MMTEVRFASFRNWVIDVDDVVEMEHDSLGNGVKLLEMYLPLEIYVGSASDARLHIVVLSGEVSFTSVVQMKINKNSQLAWSLYTMKGTSYHNFWAGTIHPPSCTSYTVPQTQHCAHQPFPAPHSGRTMTNRHLPPHASWYNKSQSVSANTNEE